jgi:hypothetical protein
MEVLPMFWDDEDDSDNMQRLKNGLFLDTWVTNETRDAVAPWLGLIALIALLVFIAIS